MIEYHYETEFLLDDKTKFTNWITRIITIEGKKLGDVSYIFCDDTYLLDLNQKYLEHDTYTDIISFDYSDSTLVSGDIFISITRLEENAEKYGVEMAEELLRVMAHGVLHFLGYKDKTKEDVMVMRKKENQMIKLFHVEQ